MGHLLRVVFGFCFPAKLVAPGNKRTISSSIFLASKCCAGGILLMKGLEECVSAKCTWFLPAKLPNDSIKVYWFWFGKAGWWEGIETQRHITRQRLEAFLKNRKLDSHPVFTLF